MNAKWLLVLGLTMLLTACAATGPTFSEQAALSPAVASHMACLTVFQTATGMKYVDLPPTIRIDGKEVGSCAYAGFNSFDVSAGTHVVAVDMWDSPGKCELHVGVLGGTTYFYEIALRPEHLAAGQVGRFFSAFGLFGSLVDGLAMYSGMTAESAGKECGGAFSITPVEESVALSKIASLRASR